MNHNEPLSIEVFSQNTHSQKDCGCLILHDVLLLYTRTHVTVIYIYYVCVCPRVIKYGLMGNPLFLEDCPI